MQMLTASGEADLTALFALPQKPHLRVNMVTSLDGAAVLDGKVGALTGPADQQLLKTLRCLADVVLVGAGTIRDEMYGPITLADETWREYRLNAGYTEVPGLAILSRSLDLDPSWAMFTQAETRPIIITCTKADQGRQDALSEVAELVYAGEDDVDLGRALQELHDRGLHRILSEGGPGILAGFFAADLVDELCLAISPILVGQADKRIISGLPDGPIRLRLGATMTAEDFIFQRYVRVGDEAAADTERPVAEAVSDEREGHVRLGLGEV